MLLSDKDKQRLIEIFSTVNIPIEIWAYGSRVNGDAHSGSNLDLVARSSDLNPLPYDVIFDLCEKIRVSNIPIIVELRDWAKLPDSFHESIILHHQVLFSNIPILDNQY